MVSSQDPNIEALYDLLHEHRSSVMALLNLYEYEVGDAQSGRGSLLSRLLGELEQSVDLEVDANRAVGVNVPVTIRLVFGAMLSTSLFNSWLFPAGLSTRARRDHRRNGGHHGPRDRLP